MRRLAIATAAMAALALVADAVQARAEIRPQAPALEPAVGPASSPAGARLHTRCRGGAIGLVVQTVPAFRGVRFTLDGRPFQSDGRGVARITVPRCGQYELSVAPPARLRPDMRMRFARWEDETFTPQRKVLLTRDTELQVGFEVEYLVRETFVDLAGRPVETARVTKIVQSNSLGSRESFAPGPPRWLIGSRVMRRTNGLQRTDILYSVRQVIMNGTNVVRQAQQRFYPRRTPHLYIQLLLYSATISATDRFFGFPIGSRIELVYPDGHVEHHALGSDSSIVLKSLPRGTYDVTVKAPGMSPTVPIAMTRDQEVQLKIVSYLDLTILFGSLGVGAVVLLLARRPRLRASLRLSSLWSAISGTHEAALQIVAELTSSGPRLLDGTPTRGIGRARRGRVAVGRRVLVAPLRAFTAPIRACLRLTRARPALRTARPLETTPRQKIVRARRARATAGKGVLTAMLRAFTAPLRACFRLARALPALCWRLVVHLGRVGYAPIRWIGRATAGKGVLTAMLRAFTAPLRACFRLARALPALCWRLVVHLGRGAYAPIRWIGRAAARPRKPALRVVNKPSPLQPARPVWDAAATVGLAPAAKEGLLALSSEVVLAVFDELMLEEADEAVPAGRWGRAREDERQTTAPGAGRAGGERPRVSRASVERMLAAASSGRAKGARAEVQVGAGPARWSNSGGFMERARATLEQHLSRRLDDLTLAALVIDGIELAGQPHVVALGITPAGATVPIGLWEGSPDVKGRALLTDLIDRGLRTSEGLLVVIDGSQALRKAVRRVFGKGLAPAPAPALEGSGEIAA